MTWGRTEDGHDKRVALSFAKKINAHGVRFPLLQILQTAALFPFYAIGKNSRTRFLFSEKRTALSVQFRQGTKKIQKRVTYLHVKSVFKI